MSNNDSHQTEVRTSKQEGSPLHRAQLILQKAYASMEKRLRRVQMLEQRPLPTR